MNGKSVIALTVDVFSRNKSAMMNKEGVELILRRCRCEDAENLMNHYQEEKGSP
jgi:hypothetical protein